MQSLQRTLEPFPIQKRILLDQLSADGGLKALVFSQRPA
jgi:hypothetical protein